MKGDQYSKLLVDGQGLLGNRKTEIGRKEGRSSVRRPDERLMLAAQQILRAVVKQRGLG